MKHQIKYDGPSMFEIAEDHLALVLSNGHFRTHSPQPLLYNVVTVGGIHIWKDPGCLPEDIQHFLDKATEGVVYVSFELCAQHRPNLTKQG